MANENENEIVCVVLHFAIYRCFAAAIAIASFLDVVAGRINWCYSFTRLLLSLRVFFFSLSLSVEL